MEPVAYVNGHFVPRSRAVVDIDDRGLLLGDSVYEVILIADGKPIDLPPHMARLVRSMTELGFVAQPDIEGLVAMIGRLIAENGIVDGSVYLQVGRGAAARDLMPATGIAASVIAQVKTLAIGALRSMRVITMPDQRWGRCDIKTTALVGAVMARMAARQAGADDAWLLDARGFVTESSASNAWIVRDGVVLTRPTGPEILSGVTRTRLMRLAAGIGIEVREVAFDRAACLAADEAFVTSASALVTAVGEIDGVVLGTGDWPITTRLHDAYLRFVRTSSRHG